MKKRTLPLVLLAAIVIVIVYVMKKKAAIPGVNALPIQATAYNGITVGPYPVGNPPVSKSFLDLAKLTLGPSPQPEMTPVSGFLDYPTYKAETDPNIFAGATTYT